MQITFYGVAVVLVLWSLYGYFGSRVEQAEYSIVKTTDDYEIRNYPAHIIAQTAVSGSYEQSMSKGFRIVAGYIFGGNTKKEKIAMTAPVVMQEKTSESIAMTAPVVVGSEEGYRTVSFGMPKSYTLETLPMPTDSRVKLVEVPNRNVAVMKFSGFRTSKKIQDMEKKLLTALSVDGVKITGSTSYAGYNAPWTPPWMIRNEVFVEIK